VKATNRRWVYESFGDPRKTWQGETGEVDHVAQLRLMVGDVPELLAVARKWAEPIGWSAALCILL